MSGRKSGLLRGWVLFNVILGAVAGALLALDLSIFLAGTLPSISTTLAAMIAGIATLALAALTGVIIVLNAGVLDATRQAAEATKAEADATLEEAKATREQAEATKQQAKLAAQSIQELRRTRELDWRPVLVRPGQVGPLTAAQGRFHRDVVLQNLGRGPALNVFYVREEQRPEGQLFLQAGPFNIAPGPSVSAPAEEQPNEAPSGLFESTEYPRELLLCQDQFGNSYAFVPGYPSPTRWSAEQAELFSSIAPAWAQAFEKLLGVRTVLEAEPSPGPYFMQEIHVGGNYATCQSTVALEAVPPSDLDPVRRMDDAVDHWMLALRPDATRRSIMPGHWEVGQSGDVWHGWLYRGPTISVREALDLEDRSGSDQYTPKAGAVRLSELCTWWKAIVIEGLRLLIEEGGAKRARIGFSLNTYGSVSQRSIVDVAFGDLPVPVRIAPDRNQSLQYWSPTAFDPAVFPAAELETSLRKLLLNFGYRDVDEVIAALVLSP